MNYAVIRTGGKQYRVSPGDTVRLEKLAGEPGAQHTFSDVLLASSEGDVTVGKPLIDGARVVGEILRHEKAKKILVFKKKRRKNYRRKKGHRQHLTAVRITEILTGGKKPSKTAAKPAAAKKAKDKKPAPKPEAKPKAKAPAKKAPAKKPAAKKPAAKK